MTRYHLDTHGLPTDDRAEAVITIAISIRKPLSQRMVAWLVRRLANELAAQATRRDRGDNPTKMKRIRPGRRLRATPRSPSSRPRCTPCAPSSSASSTSSLTMSGTP